MFQTLIQTLRELHSASGIAQIVETGGLWVLIAIVFSETGLLVGFFLPGDSLLITAGVLANPLNPHHVSVLSIVSLNIAVGLATTLGDQTGYFLGNRTGKSIWNRPDGRFYKRQHLESAHEFYERHGGLSILVARYVPIFRTFVPFVAGLARMPYRKFVLWSVAGGTLWSTSLLWIGYYLGQTALANRLDKIILVVIVVSVLPMAFGTAKRYIRAAQ